MGFVAYNEGTNEVFYFKGAYKMAVFLGISAKTVYKNAKKVSQIKNTTVLPLHTP